MPVNAVVWVPRRQVGEFHRNNPAFPGALESSVKYVGKMPTGARRGLDV